MPDQKALYPIREISRLTGVTPITLRAWERRYDLIEPVRTDTGHRLYTQSHVDFIKQAVELTQQGIPISKVKSVLTERSKTQQAVRASVDIDFFEELLQACSDYDYAQTQLLVEQVFVDLLDEQVKQILAEVSLQILTQPIAVQVLWNSIVVPLLSARIRQGRRLLDIKGRRNIYIAPLNGDHGVLQRIWANRSLENGYNPLLGVLSAEMDLIDVVKKLHCEAIVLIAPNATEAQRQSWQEWATKHPSVEVYFATNNSDIENHHLNFVVTSLSQGNLL